MLWRGNKVFYDTSARRFLDDEITTTVRSDCVSTIDFLPPRFWVGLEDNSWWFHWIRKDQGLQIDRCITMLRTPQSHSFNHNSTLQDNTSVIRHINSGPNLWPAVTLNLSSIVQFISVELCGENELSLFTLLHTTYQNLNVSTICLLKPLKHSQPPKLLFICFRCT